jgi:hypothetical protein
MPKKEVQVVEKALTCGEGLAARSALPAKLAQLLAATADVLEQHMTVLDTEDEGGRQEYAAYLRLTEDHREAAAQLHAIGERMASYRDLPVAKHDEAAMSSPQTAETFARLVSVEEEIFEQLQERSRQNRLMLDQMVRTGSR